MQIVNVVFWIVPNAVVLSVSCSWFSMAVNISGAIRWTIWNTVRLRLYMNVLAMKRQDKILWNC